MTDSPRPRGGYCDYPDDTPAGTNPDWWATNRGPQPVVDAGGPSAVWQAALARVNGQPAPQRREPGWDGPVALSGDPVLDEARRWIHQRHADARCVTKPALPPQPLTPADLRPGQRLHECGYCVEVDTQHGWRRVSARRCPVHGIDRLASTPPPAVAVAVAEERSTVRRWLTLLGRTLRR